MENKHIELSDFETVCRVCLVKKENMISMFKPILNSNLKTYREMLEECASVHISKDDSLPKNICNQCSKYLEQSYKLKIQYLSSEKLLEQIIENSQTKIKTEELSLFEKNNDFANEDNVFSLFDAEDGLGKTAKVKITVKEEFIEEDLKLNGSNDFEIQKYKCVNCSAEFISKLDYYKHDKNSHSNSTIKCIFCNKNFNLIRSLKKHCPEIIRCKICMKECGCRINLKKHINEHTTCKVCGKIFPHQQACNRHMQIHGDKRYLCTYCGKTYSDKKNHKIHLRTHTGEKPYQCSQCDAKFTDNGSLRKHYASHSNERKFGCEICKNTYKRMEYLKNHKRSHTDQEKYFCDICDKQFKSRDSLRGHKVVHSGERNHICSYCKKAFLKATTLKIHLRIHTGEKPFICNKCGKRFTQKHVLINHMKTHSKIPG